MSDPDTSQRTYRCALCRGELTVAGNINGDLISVNINGHAKAAHRVCPTAATGEWQVAESREPGVKAAPLILNPGDRIRLVFEGTVDELETGFVGATPVVSNSISTGLRLPHWLLRASHIERLVPAPTSTTD